MKKRLITLLFCGVLVVSGCGGGKSNPSPSPTPMPPTEASWNVMNYQVCSPGASIEQSVGIVNARDFNTAGYTIFLTRDRDGAILLPTRPAEATVRESINNIWFRYILFPALSDWYDTPVTMSISDSSGTVIGSTPYRFTTERCH